MSIFCKQCGSRVMWTELRCSRCSRLNTRHPAILAITGVVAVTASAAVSFVVYLSIHRHQYNGTTPGTRPDKALHPMPPSPSGDDERATEPKFFKR